MNFQKMTRLTYSLAVVSTLQPFSNFEPNSRSHLDLVPPTVLPNGTFCKIVLNSGTLRVVSMNKGQRLLILHKILSDIVLDLNICYKL